MPAVTISRNQMHLPPCSPRCMTAPRPRARPRQQASTAAHASPQHQGLCWGGGGQPGQTPPTHSTTPHSRVNDLSLSLSIIITLHKQASPSTYIHCRRSAQEARPYTKPSPSCTPRGRRRSCPFSQAPCLQHPKESAPSHSLLRKGAAAAAHEQPATQQPTCCTHSAPRSLAKATSVATTAPTSGAGVSGSILPSGPSCGRALSPSAPSCCMSPCRAGL